MTRPSCLEFATIPKTDKLTETRPGARRYPERIQERKQEGTERYLEIFSTCALSHLYNIFKELGNSMFNLINLAFSF